MRPQEVIRRIKLRQLLEPTNPSFEGRKTEDQCIDILWLKPLESKGKLRSKRRPRIDENDHSIQTPLSLFSFQPANLILQLRSSRFELNTTFNAAWKMCSFQNIIYYIEKFKWNKSLSKICCSTKRWGRINKSLVQKTLNLKFTILK